MTRRIIRRPGLLMIATVLALVAGVLPVARPAPVAALGVPPPPPGLLGNLSSQTPYMQSTVPGALLCNGTSLDRHRPVSLPADDAPHTSDARDYWEWWFWTGFLTAGGKKYSFMTYFATKPQLHVTRTAFAIGDLSGQRLHYGGDGPSVGQPSPTVDGFSLSSDHASAVGGNGSDRIRQAVDGYALDVRLTQTRAPARSLGDGFIGFYCFDGWDYHRPGMAINGTLTQNGKTMKVVGQGWFEHNWGFDAPFIGAQSDYLQLQLGDGSDVFIGRFRFPRFLAQLPEIGSRIAEVDLGWISHPDGTLTLLKRGDFTLTPVGYFSPTPTCAYPTSVDLTVLGNRYLVRSSLADAELRSVPLNNVFFAEDPTFWDGPGVVHGASDRASDGLAWIDYIGYCPGR